MEPNLNNSVPQLPRRIMGAAILPYFITAPLTPIEASVERLGYVVEVSALRPAWQIALVGALAALEGTS